VTGGGDHLRRAHLDLADLAEALQIVAERRAERIGCKMIPIDYARERLP